ncbi:serine-rich adhesin for platelets isoform X3 [Eurosta solidaginis]|uniref:serine-rich adhesin for platelets isoform X3 n=2 Tax=Eurosta solidaginis TaxID=178769 RepID=UPI0035316AF8
MQSPIIKYRSITNLWLMKLAAVIARGKNQIKAGGCEMEKICIMEYYENTGARDDGCSYNIIEAPKLLSSNGIGNRAVLKELSLDFAILISASLTSSNVPSRNSLILLYFNAEDISFIHIGSGPRPKSIKILNAISSKSENLKGINSLHPKESSLEIAPVAVVPLEYGAPALTVGAVENNACNIERIADLPGGQNMASNNTRSEVEEPYQLGNVVADLGELNPSDTAKRLNLNMGESSTTPRPYLQVNAESDTTTSSDNEIFAECQSNLVVVANSDYAFTAEDGSIENYEIESYFSAANSRNTTLTNLGADPLSLTVNKTEERNGIEQDDMQGLLSAISEYDGLAQQRIHLSDVTYEEEPMDIDISFDESNDHLEAQYSNIPLMKEMGLPSQVVQKIPSSKEIQFKQKDSKDAMAAPNNVESSVTVSANVDVDTKMRLNKNIEISTSTSPITNGVLGYSVSSSNETASEITNSANTSVNTVEEKEIKNCKIEDNRGLAECHTALNVTIEVNTSSACCPSPNFPVKHKESSPKQFPRSPIADAPKKIVYLEKSEYTDRIEIERKSSVESKPEQALPNSRKTFSVDPQQTLVAQSDKSTSNFVNAIDFKTNTHKDDTSFIKGNHEVKLNAALNANFNANVYFPKSPKFQDSTNESLPFTTVAPVGEDIKNISSPSPRNESDSRCDLNTSNIERYNEIKPKISLEEKRRTFNILAPLEVPELSNSTEMNVPINLDGMSSALSTITDSNGSTKSSQDPVESSKTTVVNSPPISIMENCPKNMSSLSVEAEIELVTARDHNLDVNNVAFKVPHPPSPASSTTSTLIPIIQKRQSIHEYKYKDSAMEILSAKEQTKRDSSDEKDVSAESVTPSPLEELPSSTCSFGNVRNDTAVNKDHQMFVNEEFHSGNYLIFNPSDFDYLLTKGNNNTPIDRSSILLKFDPLLGMPVPLNQVQQQVQQQQKIFQKIVSSKTTNLSPALEEDEFLSSASISSICNKESFVVVADNKHSSFGINTTNDREVRTITTCDTASNIELEEEQHTHQEAALKKYASMSVDVIKEVNIDNDCNKSFENSKLKTEDMEKKLKDSEQREEALIKRITDKDKTITKMTGVIEAYEKAIAELIAEKEQLIQNYEKQLSEVKTDRDSNYQHLTSLETTFTDLHVKYGKSKEMTLTLKTNEEALLAEKRQILENLRLQEQRYDKMKNHAMQQLEIANKKLESLNKEHNVETTKLKALLKKEEISRASITEQLQQKSRENAELVKICDELITGQGS